MLQGTDRNLTEYLEPSQQATAGVASTALWAIASNAAVLLPEASGVHLRSRLLRMRESPPSLRACPRMETEQAAAVFAFPV